MEGVCVFWKMKLEVGSQCEGQNWKHKKNRRMCACVWWKPMEKITPDGTFFFCFPSQNVDVHILTLYLECDIFILPLTSSIDPVRRLDDDIQGKQLDSQAAHHYLLCPTYNKRLCSAGNYQRRPRRPSKCRTWRLLGPVSNKYWLNNTTIFVYVSRVCDWLSAE